MCIYIHILHISQKDRKTDNVLSWFLPIRQWPHGNSTTWAYDVRLHSVI